MIGRLLSLHQIEININDLFSHPTARGLAGYAKRLNVAQPNAAVATADDHDRAQAPLSLAQESLWKVYEAFGHDEIFNLPFSLRFFDAVDETALRQAFIDVMTRHTVLRSRFVEQQGEVVQVVVPAAELSDYQWFRFSQETPAGNAAALLADAGQHRFDLAAELPLRVTLLRDADNGQQLLSLLFHHVVLDEWSLNLMMDELGVAYRHRVVGGRRSGAGNRRSSTLSPGSSGPPGAAATSGLLARRAARRAGRPADLPARSVHPPGGAGTGGRQRRTSTAAGWSSRSIPPWRKACISSPAATTLRCSTWCMPGLPRRCACSAARRICWWAPRPPAVTTPSSSIPSATSPP